MALVLQRRTFAYIATPQGGSGALTSEAAAALTKAEADANAFMATLNFNDVVQIDSAVMPIGTNTENAIAWVAVVHLVNQ